MARSYIYRLYSYIQHTDRSIMMISLNYRIRGSYVSEDFKSWLLYKLKRLFEPEFYKKISKWLVDHPLKLEILNCDNNIDVFIDRRVYCPKFSVCACLDDNIIIDYYSNRKYLRKRKQKLGG